MIAMNRAKTTLQSLGVDKELLHDCVLLKELIPFTTVLPSDRTKLFYLHVF